VINKTRFLYRISNNRLYEKCGSIPLSRAIMKERLRWLGHVVRKGNGNFMGGSIKGGFE
jgi:hypothetical protein